MKQFKLNGPIVKNEDQWLYDFLGIEAVSAGQIRYFLDQANQANKEDVEILINSPGGDAYSGVEIFTLLKEYPGNVTAKITGVAASAASLVICGADRVMMSPAAQIMVHCSMGGVFGNHNFLESAAETLVKLDESYAAGYMTKTKMTKEQILALMEHTTFMTAEDAKAKGFCDEIMYQNDPNLPVDAVASLPTGMLPPKLMEIVKEYLNQNGPKPSGDTPNQKAAELPHAAANETETALNLEREQLAVLSIKEVI